MKYIVVDVVVEDWCDEYFKYFLFCSYLNYIVYDEDSTNDDVKRFERIKAVNRVNFNIDQQKVLDLEGFNDSDRIHESQLASWINKFPALEEINLVRTNLNKEPITLTINSF